MRIANRWLLCVLALLSGCASFDPYIAPPITHHLERNDDVGYCARLFADVDRRIDTLDVRDAESTRIAGFPYLRVNRFNAALADRIQTPEQESAWRARLQQLDEEARATELANASLSIDDLARCRALLAAADKSGAANLRSIAKVPDDYSTAMRFFGIYPLTRLPFAAGIAQWHASTRAVFATPLEALPVRGRLQRYAPAPGARIAVPPASLDQLGIPEWTTAETNSLLMRHAPVLDVDVIGDFDRLGALRLNAEEQVVVDAGAPVVYTRLAYTLIGGLIHPQLVYTFWFSERPSEGVFDLLAGKLDGIVWRVTLDRSGDALVYDSMHACGCYHVFFPTEHVTPRPTPATTLDEGLFVPQRVRAAQANEKIVLRIESGTHYLQRVQVIPASDTVSGVTSYSLRDERALTTLARSDGGTRSAYDEDGFIPGTERTERWFFWPMGIASAGQMRQWGHHATAFVGRRHFDDPLLFDAYFEIRRCDDCAPH
ncbi:MAG: hypothetical protein ACRECQ_17480 [Burkholderiaceae bacterium]